MPTSSCLSIETITYDAESDDKNVAEIILAKNRHGATGTVELQWIGQYTTFSSRDRVHS